MVLGIRTSSVVEDGLARGETKGVQFAQKPQFSFVGFSEASDTENVSMHGDTVSLVRAYARAFDRIFTTYTGPDVQPGFDPNNYPVA